MSLDEFKELGGWIVAVVGSLLAYLGGQNQGKAALTTALHQAADKAVERAMGSLQAEIERLTKRAADSDKAHQNCEEQLQAFRNELNEYMSRPVAEYEIIGRPRLTDRGGEDPS